uniref:Uncharacterized protein n=1 Tax=Octopus bimaculoides TaxID=37653 RepID=A0A0L8GR80_OCTBM
MSDSYFKATTKTITDLNYAVTSETIVNNPRLAKQLSIDGKKSEPKNFTIRKKLLEFQIGICNHM